MSKFHSHTRKFSRASNAMLKQTVGEFYMWSDKKRSSANFVFFNIYCISWLLSGTFDSIRLFCHCYCTYLNFVCHPCTNMVSFISRNCNGRKVAKVLPIIEKER